jgi:predicted DCC family thiol-disulfide oxidoreductase YuxK
VSAPAEPDGLWVFDGVCNFCSGSVQTVLRLDRQGMIRFTPMQSAYGRVLLKRAGLDPDDPASFLFFDRGVALERTDAIFALVARLPAPWRWLTILRTIPRSWRDNVYDLLAANRYRLMGRRETCMVPSLETRARFVMEP